MPEKTEEQKPNTIADGLMRRRTIVLEGMIDMKSMSNIGMRMIDLQMRSSDPINLIIDSGGGNLDAALHLCDLMSTVMTAPVHGIALGACGSAATFVMLHCEKRVGTPYSRFLIHSGTRNEISLPINQTTSENLEHLLQDVKKTEDMVLGIYMSRLTPKKWLDAPADGAEKRAFVQSLLNRGDQRFGKWLSAEEAVEFGMIEKIVTNKLDIFAETK